MIKNRESLLLAVEAYPIQFPEDTGIRDEFTKLLAHPRSFHRDHLPGHITGSAWIVNRDRTKTVLILHAKLGRWLQPGGHADGEEDVLRVALREAEEETGLKKLTVEDPSVFDLDVHPIPARKDFPAHLHYDVRFLVFADEDEPLVISDESTGLKWFPLDDVNALTNGNPSMIRMVFKMKNQF